MELHEGIKNRGWVGASVGERSGEWERAGWERTIADGEGRVRREESTSIAVWKQPPPISDMAPLKLLILRSVPRS